jgi:hypothetical protein
MPGTALVLRVSDVRPKGRPRIYTPELGKEVCELIAQGYTFSQIGNMPYMPHGATFLGWARDIEDFSTAFRRACEVRADLWIDDTVDIADDGSRDYHLVQTETGPRIVVDHDHIKRTSIRIAARQWHAAKTNAKRYGDKSQVAFTTDNPPPVAAQLSNDPVAVQRAYQQMIKAGRAEE